MSSFWGIVDANWKEILDVIFSFHNRRDPARYLVGNEMPAETDITVDQDVTLCRIHRSPRLRSYLMAAADSEYDIVHKLLAKDCELVRSGNHPLPA